MQMESGYPRLAVLLASLPLYSCFLALSYFSLYRGSVFFFAGLEDGIAPAPLGTT